MKVVLISRSPRVETAKADGRVRAKKRGVRKGRHMVRARVSPGAARQRWAIVREHDGRVIVTREGQVTFRTRGDAERAMQAFEKRVARAHPSVRPFMTA